MTVLVTGGKGFLGAPLIRKLVDKGTEVVCLDVKTTPGRLGDLSDKITMIGGGVPGVDGLVKIIEDNNIDRIAHMVFFISSPGDVEQVRTEVSTMIMGTTDVFEAARRTGLKRVVFPSSMAPDFIGTTARRILRVRV